MRNNELVIRPLVKDDEPHLWDLLYHAIFVPAGSLAPERSIVHRPELARYVSGWGRPHDFGYAAFFESDPIPIGAVWCRLLTSDEQGYGYLEDETSELSIAVHPEHRNHGIGTILLTRLIESARSKYHAISLSVSADNLAKRLYERFDFEKLETRGTSIAMRLDLTRE